MAKLGLAPAMSIEVTWLSGLELLLFMSLVAFGLAGLGFLIAWKFDSVQGFHAIMSIFLMPMWLLSGSFFPAGNSGWMSWVIRLNPLTYGTAGLRRIMTTNAAAVAGLPEWWLCLTVTCLAAMVYVSVAVWMTNRPTVHNAR